MKKLLTAILAAGLLTAVVAAEAPKAEQFEANNGFYYGPNKSEVVQDEEHRSVPTVEDTDNGVKVAHKGYYQTGDNCGGVHSADKYDLNGLSVTLEFDLVPEVTGDTDCWFAIDFLDAPSGFYTNATTKGIEDLIRFGSNYIDVREASDVKAWESIWGSNGNVEADQAAAFGIKTGDTVTMKITRDDAGVYYMSYTNGDITIDIPQGFETLGDVFPDGKAYICIVGSCELGDQEGFIYRITDVTNGVEMTAEEIEAIAAAKAAAELAEKTDAANKLVEAAETALNEVVAEYAGYADADELIAEGQAALESVKQAIADQDFDSVQGFIDEINDKAVEAKNAGKKAIKEGAEKVTEAAEEVVEDAENAAEDVAEKVEEQAKAGFPAWAWIVIAAAVVIIAVIAVVAAKKKKN